VFDYTTLAIANRVLCGAHPDDFAAKIIVAMLSHHMLRVLYYNIYSMLIMCIKHEFQLEIIAVGI
jgi:hypothetical protein